LKSFQNIAPTLRWRPDLLQGMPVERETRRLAFVMPNCRFQLHPPLFTVTPFRRRRDRSGAYPPSMKPSPIVLVAVIALSACGGASKLSEAPRAAVPPACFATRDAARAAGAVVYANSGSYPTTFLAMTTGNAPVLSAGDGTTVTADAITGKGWKLTIKGGGSTAPTFSCAQLPYER